MIIADYHTHTSFSSDSSTPPEEMIKRAISLGLNRICITDHMDYMYPSEEEGLFVLTPDSYYKKLLELQGMYKSQIEIMIGIELGLRNEREIKEKVRAYFIELLAKYPFDFVIGSTHVLEYMDPYHKKYWEDKSTKEGLTNYFQSIIDNCNYYDEFQVYGHLDYIIRYTREEKKEYNYRGYADIIDEAIKSIVSHGKGIECNSSGYKYGLNITHPKTEILKRYKELGGEILTIGSDAHEPKYLAYEFAKVKDLLVSLGFRYYAVYKNRKPEFIKL